MTLIKNVHGPQWWINTLVVPAPATSGPASHTQNSISPWSLCHSQHGHHHRTSDRMQVSAIIHSHSLPVLKKDIQCHSDFTKHRLGCRVLNSVKPHDSDRYPGFDFVCFPCLRFLICLYCAVWPLRPTPYLYLIIHLDYRITDSVPLSSLTHVYECWMNTLRVNVSVQTLFKSTGNYLLHDLLNVVQKM